MGVRMLNVFSYIYACETCVVACDMRAVCVRNVHTLYLAPDGYCIQCMCILKLCVWLKPGRRTCIYRQFNERYVMQDVQKRYIVRVGNNVRMYMYNVRMYMYNVRMYMYNVRIDNVHVYTDY